MAATVEAQISKEQLSRASSNYLRCLNLPPKSQVLIITDKLREGTIDNNLLIRQQMTASLNQQISGAGHRVLTMEYDGSKIPTKPEEVEKKELIEDLRQKTAQSLTDLENITEDEVDRTTTIVYLGDTWINRTGIYKAANEFGNNHTIKFAGSLGFSTGDCRVISELDEEKMGKIEEANKYFEEFFKLHPKGAFEIATRDPMGTEYKLEMSYDTIVAPFESELGKLDGIHESPLSEFKNIRYVNIPGGEKYGTPYPFNQSNGKFVAEGIVFTVNKGLIVDLKFVEDRSLSSYELSQRELILAIFENKDKLPYGGLPLAELGLGFYALAGIKTYSDSSILSHEKSGPHIGMEHSVGETPEEEEIAKRAGNFRHTDFVLDNNPVIMWIDPQNGEKQQFYPPTEK